MYNRNLQNGLALAGMIIVLLGLMFATSLAVSSIPTGW